MIESITSFGTATFGGWWPLIWTLVRAVCIILPLLLCVAYLILWERKLIGWMHVRLGPNRVGPMGLLQPIADVLKLLLKEVMVPSQVSRGLYIIAPLMVLMPAVAIWAVVPF
jgi:NADH-quinone oxidoreductase subunit H